jgi:putative endopeptidase
MTSHRFPAGLRLRPAGCAVWALTLVCALPLAAQAQAAASASASARDAAVDARVHPGDDFFTYANGGWLGATEIPAGKGKWSAGAEIAEQVQRQVVTLLDDAAAAPRGSDARKVADFRAAWLNRAAIEARGMAPIKPLLQRIDHIRDRAGLARHLGSTMPADVDPLNQGVYDSAHLLGLAVQQGNRGEKTQLAYLLQGGLGLPDRDDYLGADPRLQTQRAQYQDAIADVLARLAQGRDGQATAMARRAEAAMALETAIARSHATRQASADDGNADTRWTLADFARQAPGMDWSAFFAAAGLAGQPAFVVWQPTAVTGAAALVAQQPLQAWKDYLRLRVVADHADVLPQAWSDLALRLRGAVAGAAPADAPGQRALAATQKAMSPAIGRMYAERHFPPAHKARVQAIVKSVIAAYIQRVEAVAWMQPATRATALAKLRGLYFGVGYPERWQDDAGLVIDPADAVGNLHRVARHNHRRAVARLGQAVDSSDWFVAPQWPGAALVFQLNAYNFAAALLQVPKFDASASDASNYGAIGAIAGHEISHFIDTLGADYEADGRQRRWWTADDLARYQAATEPLVRQFAAYRPRPDVAVDGQLGLTENLADLGGLVAAFDAYRATLGSAVNGPAQVREQDRQFFIGYARAWRAKYRDTALAAQAASDHAPEIYRVWTVRNVDAWYDAFDVKPGHRLYLDPAARVRIW